MKNESLDTEDIFTDSVDAFTALFYSDRIFVGEHEYPIGQCMVDILNLEERELLRLDQSLLDVYHAIQSVWQENTLESVERAQKKTTGSLASGVRTSGLSRPKYRLVTAPFPKR